MASVLCVRGKVEGFGNGVARKWAPPTALKKDGMTPTTSMLCHCSRCDTAHKRMHAEGEARHLRGAEKL
jgi:hypothetical protein